MIRRIRAWLRQDYPSSAPAQGHCYLLALCPPRKAAR
jgi:hypothetical protein